MDCFLKSFTLLLIVAIIIIMYNNQINVLFGGGDINAKCMVCTEVHYNGYLTNWTVSHFVLFAIVGYMCPKNIYLFILLGILWEFFELYLEYTSHCNHNGMICRMIACKEPLSNDHFWKHYLGFENKHLSLFWCSGGLVGGIMDIIADIMGVYVGKYLSSVLS